MSDSFLQKAVDAVNPTLTKAESYEKALHSNDTSSPWNTKKIEIAKESSVEIKNLVNETRDDAKRVFWKLPFEWSKALTRMLARPAMVIPAWLWQKTTQIPGNLAKLLTSGGLVATAETVQALDAPSRGMIKTWNRLDNALAPA